MRYAISIYTLASVYTLVYVIVFDCVWLFLCVCVYWVSWWSQGPSTVGREYILKAHRSNIVTDVNFQPVLMAG